MEKIMKMNSITGNIAEFTSNPLKAVASLDQTAKGTPSVNDQSSIKTAKTEIVDTIDINKIAPATKQTPEVAIQAQKKPVRAISHVVESYNLQGQVRTKFMDRNNNVVYQIPTEMVAKMEDQMMKPETSANIKG
jgi:hypothetical protein